MSSSGEPGRIGVGRPFKLVGKPTDFRPERHGTNSSFRESLKGRDPFPHDTAALPPSRSLAWFAIVRDPARKSLRSLNLESLTDAWNGVYRDVRESGLRWVQAGNPKYFCPRERSPALSPFREGQSRGLWRVQCGRFADHKGLSFPNSRSVRGCSLAIHVTSHFPDKLHGSKSDFTNASSARRGA